MNNRRNSITSQAHELIENHFNKLGRPLDIAIDATCGNGHDAYFLLSLGFARLIAFDVQTQAVKATSLLCKEYATRLTLYQDCHSNITQYCDYPVDCVMFNFGYLPGAQKNLTTTADTSVMAIKQAQSLLANDGLITLLCYPGHTEGKIESELILKHLDNLSSSWIARRLTHPNDSANSPFLYLLSKT